MKKFFILIIVIALPLFLFAQPCDRYAMPPEDDFEYRSQFAHFETGWYPEWLEYTNGEEILPDSLPLDRK
jgi:hypothetical protein